MNDIPVVSFAPFLTGSEEDQAQVAKEVYEAFSTVGFIYLTDHGISPSSISSIFTESARFFALPADTKLEYALRDASVNQGYTAQGAEGIGEHKECYEHRRQNTLCPDDETLPGFHRNVDSFYNQCFDLAVSVLKCLAITMELGADFFTDRTRNADPQLRLLHYPSVMKSELEKPGQSRISAHTDFGLCTLLFQDDIGGLEIDPFRTGDFKAAPPVEGTVLVNIGDLMQRLTNGRCKSTVHRVKGPPTAKDGMLPSRYSIPFFVHPDPDTVIEPITRDGEEKMYKSIVAGEWRDYNTRRNYGIGREKTSLTRNEGDEEMN